MIQQLTSLSGLAFCLVLASCSAPDTGRVPDAAELSTRPDSLVEAIVYTTLRPPNFDLFLFDETGAAPRRLTQNDATDYNAVFSPDGRWIVFTSERTGNADLFALDLEGSGEPVRLTHHAAMDDAAAFSPDGAQLAFVSTREGDADIFVMPFRTGDEEAEDSAINLTRRPGGDFNPTFSPDGRRIAYSRQEELWHEEDPDPRQERRKYITAVYVMNADGSDVQRVSESGTPFEVGGERFGRNAGSPAWALDGRALYYHAVGGDGPEIRRFALDGAGDTKVVGPGVSPAIAADGRIFFTRPQPREGMDEWDALTRTGRIFSVTAGGVDLRAESNDERSCFAADIDRRSGHMVCHGPSPVEDLAAVDIPGGGWAFAPPGARLTVELPDRAIVVIGIRGYFPSLTAAGEVVSTLFNQGAPGPLGLALIDGKDPRTVFSRDGEFVWGTSIARDAGWAVTAVGPPFAPGEASVDIWKVPLDGSAAVNLTADLPGNHALPHVSADGRRIVFRTGGDGGGSIHIMNADGTDMRQLGDSTAIETMPALSPDGEWVVFSTSRAKGRKLWIERVDGTEGRFLEPDRLDIPDLSMHPRFSPDGRWVVFTSDRAGFNDEWTTGWFPQPYGELHAVPVAGGPAVRLTHNKWEDGPSDWGRVAIPGRR
jgi:Tol biopolymer transport system component